MISYSHWGMFDNGGPKWEAVGLNSVYVYETGEILHWSSCAVYNAPALPVGPCNCGGYPA